MLRSLALFLPVLMPSWRFFAMVAPSPRVEFTLLREPHAAPDVWQEFRPRPAKVPMRAMLGRMICNAHWNETLFITSCAERYLGEGTQKCFDHILAYLISDLQGKEPAKAHNAQHVQVRFIVVTRDEDRIVREEVYRSPVYPLETVSSAK